VEDSFLAGEEARHDEIISIGYDPEFPNKGGLEDRFKLCLSEYGDENAKARLNLEGYLAAQAAATDAGIDTSEELSLWENENSLRTDSTYTGRNVWDAKPGSGETGPIQLKRGASDQLAKMGKLPTGWNSNLQANLTAGARYYAWLLTLTDPVVPRSEAAAAYNQGTAWRGSRKNGTLHRRYKDYPQAANYQRDFDQHQATFKNLDNCMKTGK